MSGAASPAYPSQLETVEHGGAPWPMSHPASEPAIQMNLTPVRPEGTDVSVINRGQEVLVTVASWGDRRAQFLREGLLVSALAVAGPQLLGHRLRRQHGRDSPPTRARHPARPGPVGQDPLVDRLRSPDNCYALAYAPARYRRRSPAGERLAQCPAPRLVMVFRTRSLGRPVIRHLCRLPPRRHIRRAGPTRQRERRPRQVPEAPTGRHMQHRSAGPGQPKV